MKKDVFMDNLSDETLAEMIDKALRYERKRKSGRRKIEMIKIISIAVVCVLAIGLINLTGIVNITDLINFDGFNFDNFSLNREKAVSEVVGTVVVTEQDDIFRRGGMTEVPKVVEKNLFEDLLANIPDHLQSSRVVSKMNAYYRLKDLDGIEFYVLDQEASERELNEILDYWNKYIGWNEHAYQTMIEFFGMAEHELLRDPYADYAHVRFGETKNILLLDIEWHTVETYTAAYGIEERKNIYIEFQKSDEYALMSEEEKETTDSEFEIWIETFDNEHFEKIINLIKEGKYYEERLVNGDYVARRVNNVGLSGQPIFNINQKENEDITEEEIARHFDEDGYYIYNVYPAYIHIFYYDENAETGYRERYRDFGIVNSKQQFNSLLKNEIIPFLDDLMERGFLTQAQYDWYIRDPLSQAVERYFDAPEEQ